MNQKELKELIEFLIEKDIAEFELERGDVKVKIRRAGETPAVVMPDARYVHVPAASPVATIPHIGVPASPPVSIAAQAVPAPEENLHIVKSPIVGTFYEAPSPGAPPFVKAGDMLEVGQILCIVEAMKLMNEIECDVAGELGAVRQPDGEVVDPQTRLGFAFATGCR